MDDARDTDGELERVASDLRYSESRIDKLERENAHLRAILNTRIHRLASKLGPLLHRLTVGGASSATPSAEPRNAVQQTGLSAYVSDLLGRSGSLKNPASHEHVPLGRDSVDAGLSAVKVIAFYQPQLPSGAAAAHGLADWTNVANAVPQFVDHYQPRLPGELGFYDLRVPAIPRRQIELAKQYGIFGFCFHWFGGKQGPGLPLENYLADRSLDFPFCLCWANDGGTRPDTIHETERPAMEQRSPEVDLRVLEETERYLTDPRYIKIDGKAAVIVRDIERLPDCRATIERWRQHWRGRGHGELYLILALTFEGASYVELGFDAAAEFPPHLSAMRESSAEYSRVNPDFTGHIYEYSSLAPSYNNRDYGELTVFRAVVPGWDNTARKSGTGDVIVNGTPQTYAGWLDNACRKTVDMPPGKRFVFVNAWNDWANGAYLEPDRRYGYAYLHATANVVRRHSSVSQAVEAAVAESQRSFRKKAEAAVILHLYYDDLLDDFKKALDAAGVDLDVFVSIRDDASEASVARLRSMLPDAYLASCANRGRDILPFLKLAQIARGLGFELVCKLHTKKSPQLPDGEQWRKRLWRVLLGSRANVRAVLAAYSRMPDLGLVAVDGGLMRLDSPSAMMNNKNNLDSLLRRLNLTREIDRYSAPFPAGSMFWSRLSSLAPLLDSNLDENDFEPEVGQTDGALAHAVERVFGLAAASQGFRVVEMSEVTDDTPA